MFDSKEVEEALQDICHSTVHNYDVRSNESTAVSHDKDMISATDDDIDVEPNVTTDDNSKSAKKKTVSGTVRQSETPRTGLGGGLNAKSNNAVPEHKVRFQSRRCSSTLKG